MTAVIYARYSSDNQREESIEGQIRECTAYAEKNGITIVKHYIDRAISAKTDNRPQFQQMIKDSDKKLFDIVLVWKLDRFARNRYDSARYKTQLKKNGVKLINAISLRRHWQNSGLEQGCDKKGNTGRAAGCRAPLHRPVQIFLCTGQSPPVRGILKAE